MFWSLLYVWFREVRTDLFLGRTSYEWDVSFQKLEWAYYIRSHEDVGQIRRFFQQLAVFVCIWCPLEDLHSWFQWPVSSRTITVLLWRLVCPDPRPIPLSLSSLPIPGLLNSPSVNMKEGTQWPYIKILSKQLINLEVFRSSIKIASEVKIKFPQHELWYYVCHAVYSK